MLVDIRTYRCRPGTLNAHLALYEKFGKSPQYRCLGEPLAFLQGETGDPNEFVHIWVYENAGDREAKRAFYGLMRNGWPIQKKVPSWARWKARKIS